MTAFPLSNTTVRIPTLLLDRLHQGLPSRTRAATIRMIVTNYCMQEQRPVLPQVAALTKRGEKLSRRRQLAAALGCKSCTNPVYLGLPRRELAMWRDYAKQVGFSSVSCLVSHALAAHLGVRTEGSHPDSDAAGAPKLLDTKISAIGSGS